jgi:PAS domain S-box-containing protein
LGWVGRGAQYLGAVYLLAGVAFTLRERRARGLPFSELFGEIFSGLDGNYRALVEGNTDVIVSFDRGLRLRYLNPAAEAATGRPREQLVGRPLAEAGLEAANLARMTGCIQAVFDRGQVESTEVEYETPRGRRTFLCTFFPQRGRRGQPVRVLGVGRDITELKQKERALAESGQRLQTVFDKAPVGMAQVGLDGRAWRVNRALCQMLGYAAHELSGMSFRELTHPQDLAEDVGQLQRLLAGEIEEYTLEKRYLRKDGETIWGLLSVSLVRGPEGEPLHYIGVVEDITQSKRATQALHQANLSLTATAAALQEANEEMSQFTYAVSHDLKAPLRAVSNFASFLQEDLAGELEPEQEELLEGLGEAVGQCQTLIDDLLALSRVSRLEVEPEEVELASLVREVWERLEPGDAELVLAGEPLRLSLQRPLLQQILQNLLSNAVKFNRSSPPRVEVGWPHDGRGAFEIYVRDNGIGIEPRHQERVFGLFQRLHGEAEYSGTGLGLAIVRRAAARLGGSVSLRSRPGQGSTFRLALPPRSVQHD